MNAARDTLAELIGLDAVRTPLAATVSGLDIRYDHEDGGHPLVGARLPHTGLILRCGDATDTTALLHRACGVLLDLASDGSGDGLVPQRIGRTG